MVCTKVERLEYKYHMELKELLNGFNDMRAPGKGIHTNCNYKCTEICDAPQSNPTNNSTNQIVEFQIHKGLIELWTSILCPKPTLAEWYSKQRLMSDYNHCGVHILKLYTFELQTNKVIHWQNIRQEVVGQNEDGNQDMKASKVEYHDTHPSELIKYLKPHLKAFVLHNFISRWQDVQFKDCLTNVLEETIMSYVDFSKNYNLMVQNEIQNMH